MPGSFHAELDVINNDGTNVCLKATVTKAGGHVPASAIKVIHNNGEFSYYGLVGFSNDGDTVEVTVPNNGGGKAYVWAFPDPTTPISNEVEFN